MKCVNKYLKPENTNMNTTILYCTERPFRKMSFVFSAVELYFGSYNRMLNVRRRMRSATYGEPTKETADISLLAKESCRLHLTHTVRCFVGS